MSKLFSLGLALLLAITVGGCELYFGDGNDSNGDGPRPGGGNECSSDRDCAAGCFCVVPEGRTSGVCEEAGFCSTSADCPAGYVCDDRSSCVPDPSPARCNGAVAPSCTNGAPRCPAGQVPLVKDGCWADINGDGQYDCSLIGACEAPPTCQAFQHATDCDAATGCTVVTKGINCRAPNGSACQDGQPGCVCAMYVYDRCE